MLLPFGRQLSTHALDIVAAVDVFLCSDSAVSYEMEDNACKYTPEGRISEKADSCTRPRRKPHAVSHTTTFPPRTCFSRNSSFPQKFHAPTEISMLGKFPTSQGICDLFSTMCAFSASCNRACYLAFSGPWVNHNGDPTFWDNQMWWPLIDLHGPMHQPSKVLARLELSPNHSRKTLIFPSGPRMASQKSTQIPLSGNLFPIPTQLQQSEKL